MKMVFLAKYNKNFNYIGSSDLQKKITKHYYKKYSALNYSSYVHDELYTIMWFEKGIVNRVCLKIGFDFVFLMMIILRSIKSLQFRGLILGIIFFIILIVSTPYYFYKNRLY